MPTSRNRFTSEPCYIERVDYVHFSRYPRISDLTYLWFDLATHIAFNAPIYRTDCPSYRGIAYRSRELATSVRATSESVYRVAIDGSIDGRPPTLFSTLSASGRSVGGRLTAIFSWSARGTVLIVTPRFSSLPPARSISRTTDAKRSYRPHRAVTIASYSLIDCNCFRFPRSSFVPRNIHVTRMVRGAYVCVNVRERARPDRRPICIFEPRSLIGRCSSFFISPTDFLYFAFSRYDRPAGFSVLPDCIGTVTHDLILNWWLLFRRKSLSWLEENIFTLKHRTEWKSIEIPEHAKKYSHI